MQEKILAFLLLYWEEFCDAWGKAYDEILTLYVNALKFWKWTYKKSGGFLGIPDQWADVILDLPTALANLAQNEALAPVRAGIRLLAADFPVPRELNSKVITLADAVRTGIRWSVEETLDLKTQNQRGEATFHMIERAKKRIALWKFFRTLEVIPFLKSRLPKVVSIVVSIVFAMVRWIQLFSFLILLWKLAGLLKDSESRAHFFELSLPQNSQRKYEKQYGQHRIEGTATRLPPN